MNVDTQVKEFLRNLGQKYSASKVILFGSRARGDNHEKSDYDIAFFGIENIKYKSDIQEQCEVHAPTLKKIDVSFDQDLNEKFLQNINKEGIVLYERNKNK